MSYSSQARFHLLDEINQNLNISDLDILDNQLALE
jgi:hypothetical protein